MWIIGSVKLVLISHVINYICKCRVQISVLFEYIYRFVPKRVKRMTHHPEQILYTVKLNFLVWNRRCRCDTVYCRKNQRSFFNRNGIYQKRNGKKMQKGYRERFQAAKRHSSHFFVSSCGDTLCENIRWDAQTANRLTRDRVVASRKFKRCAHKEKFLFNTKILKKRREFTIVVYN